MGGGLGGLRQAKELKPPGGEGGGGVESVNPEEKIGKCGSWQAVSQIYMEKQRP